MNTTGENMNDDMLVKYLLGEATEAEQAEVQAWISATADNEKYFEHFKLIWEQSKQLAAKSTVNTDEAWQRFVRRTEAHAAEQQTQQEERPAPRVIPLMRRTWMRAAVVLLGFGLAFTVYKMNNTSVQTMIVRAADSPVTDTLPDGSVVVLNKNSYIAYQSKFEGKERNVTLQGEAFFTVTPDKTKPFIIDANNTSVTVVGTSFNVKTSVSKTEVIVETGIVQVAKQQKTVKLLPNQKATVEGNNAPATDSSRDELYNYYRTKEFVCRNTPLGRLIPVLNEAYDAHIVLADAQTAAKPMSVTLKSTEPLESILDVIKNAHPGLEITRRGTEIIIK